MKDFVILVPSLNRPEKCARTVEALSDNSGWPIIVGVQGDLDAYWKAARNVPNVSLREIPEQWNAKGCGAAYRWLGMNALAEGFRNLVFCDDDVTITAGELGMMVIPLGWKNTGVVTRGNGGTHPSQLWAVPAHVYREVGGFSSLSRGENVELQVRIAIAGFETIKLEGLKAKGELWQPDGGMFEVEKHLAGDPREASRLADYVWAGKMYQRYGMGILKYFIRETGKWQLNKSRVRELAKQYQLDEINLDPDFGVMYNK